MGIPQRTRQESASAKVTRRSDRWSGTARCPARAAWSCWRPSDQTMLWSAWMWQRAFAIAASGGVTPPPQGGAPRQRITPYTPRHNGKVECNHRIRPRNSSTPVTNVMAS